MTMLLLGNGAEENLVLEVSFTQSDHFLAIYN